MKISSLILVAILSCGLAFCQSNGTFYGEQFNAEKAAAFEDIKPLLEKDAKVETTISGTILSTCAKKGCWMNLKLANGEEMRVTFKDYGFFVPTSGVDGKSATITGILERTVTDVATLRHFAEDAGKSEEEINNITEPKEELSFTATGVLIKS
ncbi:MAG: DUF4920 domain-containing protein [Luteibaculum sp.]